MNSGNQRDADNTLHAAHQYPRRLARMSQYIGRLCIGLGGLMQAFYTGHLFTRLGDFYAVAAQYGFSVEPHQMRMAHEYLGGP